MYLTFLTFEVLNFPISSTVATECDLTETKTRNKVWRFCFNGKIHVVLRKPKTKHPHLLPLEHNLHLKTCSLKRDIRCPSLFSFQRLIILPMMSVFQIPQIEVQLLWPWQRLSALQYRKGSSGTYRKQKQKTKHKPSGDKLFCCVDTVRIICNNCTSITATFCESAGPKRAASRAWSCKALFGQV